MRCLACQRYGDNYYNFIILTVNASWHVDYKQRRMLQHIITGSRFWLLLLLLVPLSLALVWRWLRHTSVGSGPAAVEGVFFRVVRRAGLRAVAEELPGDNAGELVGVLEAGCVVAAYEEVRAALSFHSRGAILCCTLCLH